MDASAKSQASDVQRRVKTGCLTCRKRHVKCDERRPQCRRCEVAGRPCLFPVLVSLDSGEATLEDDEYFEFAKDQVWVDTPPSLRFLNYVRQREDAINDQDENRLDAIAPESHQLQQRLHAHPAIATSPETTTSYQTDDGSQSVKLVLPPVSQFLFSDRSSSRSASVKGATPLELLNTSLPIYLSQPRGPLEDPEQSHLLTFYIENLSGWLGLNDPRHHFSAYIPQLAMRCPMLLDAIFAFSARYMSRANPNISPIKADEYHYSCVCRLIAALKDIACASENALALSTVILRMHEMLSSRSVEADLQRHLRGSLSLFSYNANRFGPGSLKHTAFWTYVRQEILTALQSCSPTNIDTSDKTYRVVFSGESDDDWTNNITWITARVINHCFSTGVTALAEEHRQLITVVDNWRQELPDSFDPLSILTDDEPFPSIFYVCPWHILAMQFYHLCKVILILRQPLVSKVLGLDEKAEATKHAVQICGIVRGLTTSQPCRYPGALVNAAEILAYCGTVLRMTVEQLGLLALLRRIEADTTWDVAPAIENLENVWREYVTSA